MRPSVEEFANAMEDKLQLHDDKSSWTYEPLEYLLARLDDETSELEDARYTRDLQAMQEELVNIANFCMMIWDNIESGRY
jgi:NTP pyrophosphatase (non-canonical NTP hydrolase)